MSLRYDVDMGRPGGDKSVEALYRRPSKLRLLMRRLKLDRSTWQYKLVGFRDIR